MSESPATMSVARHLNLISAKMNNYHGAMNLRANVIDGSFRWIGEAIVSQEM